MTCYHHPEWPEDRACAACAAERGIRAAGGLATITREDDERFGEVSPKPPKPPKPSPADAVRYARIPCEYPRGTRCVVIRPRCLIPRQRGSEEPGREVRNLVVYAGSERWCRSQADDQYGDLVMPATQARDLPNVSGWSSHFGRRAR